METTRYRKDSKHGFHHLTPLEIIAISDAVNQGVKVADLAKNYRVSRQTIYNAINTSKSNEFLLSQKEGAPAKKRRRASRISPEIENKILEMKLKYPSWGVDYLRQNWISAGNAPLSRASIYRILREAGVKTRAEADHVRYKRFEMKRPGQLYQIDIQGKIYLPSLGWVYGHAMIDDYSRYVPAFIYYTDQLLTNGILTLNRAIEKHGVPEAIYVDNGTQFKSRGSRMNNFELFCSAHGIKIVTSTPYRPQGKGKIERLFETVENQFIAWVRVRLEEDPNYSLAMLNRDLDEYLQTRYHVRIHGGTKEKPLERFTSGSLRISEPPIEVTKYLERSFTRTVNKFGEISFKGYKIQVDLPARTRPIIVETLETIRIEYSGRLIREVDKHMLSKDPDIKHQDGVSNSKPDTVVKTNDASDLPATPPKRLIMRHGSDKEGFYYRKVGGSGNFKLKGISYYLSQALAGCSIRVKISGNVLLTYNEERQLLRKIPILSGRKY